MGPLLKGFVLLQELSPYELRISLAKMESGSVGDYTYSDASRPQMKRGITDDICALALAERYGIVSVWCPQTDRSFGIALLEYGFEAVTKFASDQGEQMLLMIKF